MDDRFIFLDIDGVLNGHEWCHLGHRDVPSINPDCVRVFNVLIEKTGAQVIIHSTWRNKILEGHVTCKGFGWMLQSHGAICEVAGVVRGAYEGAAERSIAIEQHASTHEITNWIAIDDLPLAVSRQIRTDPSKGLRPYHVKKAEELFRDLSR